MKKVNQYMVKEVPTIMENNTLKEILVIFSKTTFSTLPVVNSANKLTGLIRIETLIHHILFAKEDVLEKTPYLANIFSDTINNVDNNSTIILAKDMKQKNVFSVKESDSMVKAAVIMKKKNVHRLIVVNEENIPTGYISGNEICKAFLT